MKHNLSITAYLNLSDEGGCKPSAHFKEHFVDNKKLHPDLKSITVKVEHAVTEPEVVLTDGFTPIKTIKGNELLRPDLYQEDLLKLMRGE